MYKSANVIPIIFLDGPIVISSISNILRIAADISFQDECLTTSVSFSYNINWDVNVTTIDPNEIIDTTKYLSLMSLLYTMTNNDILSIDIGEYLQHGLIYEFKIIINCNNGYNCDTESNQIVRYDYSDIICQIEGGNKNLNNITIDTIANTNLNLNGDTFYI